MTSTFEHQGQNSLLFQSTSVVQALYDTQWYEASPRVRRNLLSMMTRTMKPTRLTGGKLCSVSLETYRAVRWPV
jgi:hypothetical protein